VGAIGIPTSTEPADEAFRFNLEGSGLTYHLSKRYAEERVLAEAARGLDAVIVNPASIQRTERTVALLDKVRRNSWITYFTGGNCIVHTDDVVGGIVAALDRGRRGERYILGGENVTFRAQAERAARLLGVERRFVRVPPLATWAAAAVLEPLARRRKAPPRIAHMIHYCANRFQFYDSSKAARELGYRARDFAEILSEAQRAIAARGDVAA
jgi:dihydroflavonol-4-reductase